MPIQALAFQSHEEHAAGGSTRIMRGARDRLLSAWRPLAANGLDEISEGQH
jgi:hypothetical protein